MNDVAPIDNWGEKGGRPNPSPLKSVSPTSFGEHPPAMRWVVEGLAPLHAVTALYGDGGVGKSLLMQQLQTCTALGEDWLGLKTQPSISLGVYCEDDMAEIERRQANLNSALDCKGPDLGDMHILVRPGEDNRLMTFSNGSAHPTRLFTDLSAHALELGATVIMLDSLAEVFGGNENDRSQVHQFVSRALGGLARAIGGSVICCAHPSRTGMATRHGDAGSTGWTNAFRSRAYLERIGAGDFRRLSLKKSNYSKTGHVTEIQWRDGCFVPKGAHEKQVSPGDVDEAFLTLLDKLTSQGKNVSRSSQASNYAPKVFAKECGSRAFKTYDFEMAMQRLLERGEIAEDKYGRPSKPAFRIARQP